MHVGLTSLHIRKVTGVTAQSVSGTVALLCVTAIESYLLTVNTHL